MAEASGLDYIPRYSRNESHAVLFYTAYGRNQRHTCATSPPRSLLVFFTDMESGYLTSPLPMLLECSVNGQTYYPDHIHHLDLDPLLVAFHHPIMRTIHQDTVSYGPPLGSMELSAFHFTFPITATGEVDLLISLLTHTPDYRIITSSVYSL